MIDANKLFSFIDTNLFNFFYFAYKIVILSDHIQEYTVLYISA